MRSLLLTEGMHFAVDGDVRTANDGQVDRTYPGDGAAWAVPGVQPGPAAELAERFQQTMKKWLRAQPAQPRTIAELQALLDRFTDEYNHHRPHRSLPHRATPATLYDSMPKALPGPTTNPQTHDRVRHDRVDKAGSVTLRYNSRLHHIGVGRTHAGTCVILLIQDLQIRVVNAATGELLRELILDPTRDYQPAGTPNARAENPQNEQHPDLHSQVRVSPMS